MLMNLYTSCVYSALHLCFQSAQSAFHWAAWDLLQMGQLASRKWQKVSLFLYKFPFFFFLDFTTQIWFIHTFFYPSASSFAFVPKCLCWKTRWCAFWSSGSPVTCLWARQTPWSWQITWSKEPLPFSLTVGESALRLLPFPAAGAAVYFKAPCRTFGHFYNHVGAQKKKRKLLIHDLSRPVR